MPFDQSGGSVEMDVVRDVSIAFAGPGPFDVVTPDPTIARRARIQRVVDITAGILFGALGAFAGAALVILMLVALVIPTTTTLALVAIAVPITAVAFVVWLRRRTVKTSDDLATPQMDFAPGVPA